MDLKPVNRKEDPFGDNARPKVVPASMAGGIQPDVNGLPDAGHKRDEMMRVRRDRLEEQMTGLPERGGVDVSSIPIEHEIAQAFDAIGNLSVSKMRPDRVYKWKKADDQQTTLAQQLGFQLVDGDPRVDLKCENWEGIEHIGKHCAQGTTLRGRGDVLLWWMPRERYKALEDFFRRRGIEMGQVAEKFVQYGDELAARGLTPRNLAHATDKPTSSDPLIQRVFANGPTQAAAMDRVLRQGSLPGADPQQIFARR